MDSRFRGNDERKWKLFSPHAIKKRSKRSSGLPLICPITILSLDNFPNCPETVEDRDTFEGNAVKKAVEVCQCTGKPALADDSGLEVDAFERSARGLFSPVRRRHAAGTTSEITKSFLPNSRMSRTRKGAPNSSVAWPWPSLTGRSRPFSATPKVVLGVNLEGKTGFGYDPVFIPDGHERTFAEMSGEEKDRLSHRGKALEKLADFLHQQPHL